VRVTALLHTGETQRGVDIVAESRLRERPREGRCRRSMRGGAAERLPSTAAGMGRALLMFVDTYMLCVVCWRPAGGQKPVER